MNRLSIELLSVFGMNPVGHVELAAELGCAFVSTGLSQLPFNPLEYCPWSLRDEAHGNRQRTSALVDASIRRLRIEIRPTHRRHSKLTSELRIMPVRCHLRWPIGMPATPRQRRPSFHTHSPLARWL
jgi:hypothetical protein